MSHPDRVSGTAQHRVRRLEIAVQDPVGARLALAAGADRVELCSALSTGGLTPSIGLVASVVEAASEAFGAVSGTASGAVSGEAAGAVQVLVRPREGGYVHDPGELATMVRDVRALRGTGVGGVVVGALTRRGALDVPAMAALMDAAGELTVTFHRAIDACPDPLAVLEQLMMLGVDRVLTSGGAARSADGVSVISRLAKLAGGVLEVVAGGGVRVADIPALLGAGAGAVHLSARTRAADAGPAGPGGGLGTHTATDPQVVAAAVAAVGLFNEAAAAGEQAVSTT